MEFIRGAQTQKTWDIVTGAIAICKKIGLKSLAEGVETEEQAQHLRDAGCDMLQGYLYSRPLPLDDVIKIAQSGEGLTRDDPHA
jgi:EAL domain-containing protein (putative c-di-GMP-specific phosphodiesterase class I)